MVIGWDQPGAGKSYGAIAHEDLTLDVYLDDASAPVDYALARFGAVNGGDTIGDIMSPEYGLLDKFRYATGLLETLDCFYPKLWEEDLRDSVPELAVPAYFLLGRHDINASIPLFEDYFAALKAPDKAGARFERSGHNPWLSERGLFVQELVRLAGVDR